MAGILLLILVLGAILALPAAASELPERAASPAMIESSIRDATGHLDPGLADRLSTPLARAVERSEARQVQGITGPERRTYVYVSLEPGRGTSLLDGCLSQIVNRDERNGLASARVTDAELRALASLDGVRKVREVVPPVVSAGRYMTEGDRVLRTDLVRQLGNVTGAGIRVGVISDGVDGLAAAQQGGDLPQDVHVLNTPARDDVEAEGTAMLEIVHDIAPGAELYFHTCGDDVLAFNNAVDALVAQGCRVIVDDVTWPSEPFFEDGVVARHAAGVIASDEIVFVSCAGNYATTHFQGTYRDDGTGFHDFSGTGSGTPYLYATVPPGGSVMIALQWNEAFGRAAADFDLGVIDAMTGEILAGSIDPQDGFGDPLEGLTFSHTGSGDLTIGVVVERVSGASEGMTLEVILYDPSGDLYIYPDNIVAADSIWGHAALPDVVTVGAVGAGSPGRIQEYSSIGPVTHFYPARTVRQKPDICGVDDVSVSGSGGFNTPFIGTSAAAPHVAALCALAWSADPALTGAQVRNALYRSAADLGPSGYDTVHGWGLADAAAMHALLTGSSMPATNVTVTPAILPPGEASYAQALAHYAAGGQAWSRAWGASEVGQIRQHLDQAKASYTACFNTSGAVNDPSNAANLALLKTISSAYIGLADGATAMYDGADFNAAGRSQMTAGTFAVASTSFQSAGDSFARSQSLFNLATRTLQSVTYSGTSFGDGTAYTAAIVSILDGKAAYMGEFATYARGWQHTALAYQALTVGDRGGFSSSVQEAMNLFAVLRTSPSFGPDARTNYEILAALLQNPSGTFVPMPSLVTPTAPLTPTPTTPPASIPTPTVTPITTATSPPVDTSQFATVVKADVMTLNDNWDADAENDGIVVYPALRDSSDETVTWSGAILPVAIEIWTTKIDENFREQRDRVVFRGNGTIESWEDGHFLLGDGIRVPFESLDVPAGVTYGWTYAKVFTPDGRAYEGVWKYTRLVP